MISNTIKKAVNEQINREFYSSYFYLAMAAHFDAQGLPGFATWMKVQAAEEWEHGMKFYQYLNDTGSRVELAAIAQPPLEYGTPKEVFKQVYEHEQSVTASINALYELARTEKDPKTEIMLHWFITEQVEEEKNDRDILDQLELAGGNTMGIMQLDHILGSRTAG
jgi:ferritin